jgi:hypothetical protein
MVKRGRPLKSFDRRLLMKRRRGLILVPALALLGGLLNSGEAAATDYCAGQDHGIWLVQSQPSGYGSWSEIHKTNDALVACTSGASYDFAFAVHTAGVTFTLSSTSFVEVGLYRTVSCGFLGCDIDNNVFGEWGWYPYTGGPYFYDTYTTGGTVDMKISNVTNTFDWKLRWDVPAGGSINWVLLDTFEDMLAQKGWAWGEHARIGKTGTGGYDHHYDMKFLNGQDQWKPINVLECWIDNDADWEWVDISDTEFIVDEGSRPCTPSVY